MKFFSNLHAIASEWEGKILKKDWSSKSWIWARGETKTTTKWGWMEKSILNVDLLCTADVVVGFPEHDKPIPAFRLVLPSFELEEFVFFLPFTRSVNHRRMQSTFTCHRPVEKKKMFSCPFHPSRATLRNHFDGEFKLDKVEKKWFLHRQLLLRYRDYN